jgi:hypothetical protein
VLTVLVVVSLILSVAAVALAGRPFLQEREARSRDEGPPDGRGEARAGDQARAVARLEGAVRQLAGNQKKLVELSQGSVRHVGVVRFDAFEDMGGRLSFSAALLDGHGDGVVITSINGRQDTRCYAKQVENWTSIHNLSDEERQAIREALGKAEQRAAAEAR